MVKIATEYIKYYENENGPKIGVTKNNVIEENGLYFRDISSDGKMHVYNDWRKDPKVRAESLKDENGKAYAYKDSNGHYYEYGFRLEK